MTTSPNGQLTSAVVGVETADVAKHLRRDRRGHARDRDLPQDLARGQVHGGGRQDLARGQVHGRGQKRTARAKGGLAIVMGAKARHAPALPPSWQARIRARQTSERPPRQAPQSVRRARSYQFIALGVLGPSPSARRLAWLRFDLVLYCINTPTLRRYMILFYKTESCSGKSQSTLT